MKKQILASFGFVVVTATVAMGAATPGSGILGSPHDMRNTTVNGQDGQARACAFCHTPHHALATVTPVTPDDYYPLWSRQIDSTVFKPYASTTINSSDYNADIAVGPTRICMSCHDGSIAVDQHYGGASGTKFLTETGFLSAGVGQGATGLTNDHPVGMNYNDVAIGPVTGDPTPETVLGALTKQDPWIRKVDSTLVYKNNKFNVKVGDRLYVPPSDPSKAYMTCATCHDVHNKKNADLPTDPNNLVLAPQMDSALCLTCHIK